MDGITHVSQSVSQSKIDIDLVSVGLFACLLAYLLVNEAVASSIDLDNFIRTTSVHEPTGDI